MNLGARTLLCNVSSRLLSYFNGNFPLQAEPIGIKKRFRRGEKEIPWQSTVDGNKVLKIFPELSQDDLSALIEGQIKNEYAGLSDKFAKPYVVLQRNNDKGECSLSIRVAPPTTSNPHVIYRFGVKEFDFSKVCFELSDIEKFKDAYISTTEIEQSKGKGRPANLEHWKQTIENGTKLLVKLYAGEEPPLTKETARKKVEANKQAFEIWWQCVPKKYKSGL